MSSGSVKTPEPTVALTPMQRTSKRLRRRFSAGASARTPSASVTALEELGVRALVEADEERLSPAQRGRAQLPARAEQEARELVVVGRALHVDAHDLRAFDDDEHLGLPGQRERLVALEASLLRVGLLADDDALLREKLLRFAARGAVGAVIIPVRPAHPLGSFSARGKAGAGRGSRARCADQILEGVQLGGSLAGKDSSIASSTVTSSGGAGGVALSSGSERGGGASRSFSSFFSSGGGSWRFACGMVGVPPPRSLARRAATASVLGV